MGIIETVPLSYDLSEGVKMDVTFLIWFISERGSWKFSEFPDEHLAVD